MRCDEVDELAGALALGAALPEEVAAVQEHTASCERCRALLRELTATAGLLAESVEQVEPPAHLRERILAAARADAAPASSRDGEAVAPRASPPEHGAGGAPPGASPVATPAVPPPAPITAAMRRPAGRPRPAPAWLAAAAVLLLAVGMGAWNIRLQRDLRARDDRLAAQERALAALAQGGQLTAFTVTGPGVGGARGTVLRPAQGQAVVALEGLARPPDGRVYQLWAMRGGQPVDLGTFTPGDDGRSVITLPDLTGADAVAVTVEARRVAAPTSAPVLVAPLA